MLNRIEDQENGTVYDVALKKSEQERLSTWNNYNGHGTAPRPNGHKFPIGQSPIAILQYIFDNYVGKNRTKAQCEALVSWCQQELFAGTILQVPTFEMVPVFASKVASSAAPTTPKGRKMKAGTPGSRATRSGGVKKTKK